MPERIGYTAKKEDDGKLLERILQSALGLTEHQIRSAKYRQDGICLNGERVRVNTPIHAGDRLEVCLETRSPSDLVTRHRKSAWPGPPVTILFEDEDLLVVGKPAGMALHPAHGHYGDTLCDWAADYLSDREEISRIRAVGRLDKDTSGLVVFAKNAVCAARLSRPGACRKTYTAFCLGSFPEVEEEIPILLPLKKAEGELNKMTVCRDGLSAATYIRVLANYTGAAKIEARLESGRTHQIRAHLSAVGHPLLGDPVYGGETALPEHSGKPPVSRTALHCGKMALAHPFTGETIRLTAPLAEDLCKLEKWLSS